MADYNLLLVAIPEDTRSLSLQTKKISLKLYFDMIFYARFRPQLLRYFPSNPQIFLTFRVWINPKK